MLADVKITARDVKELRLRRQIEELERQVDEAWDIFYGKYTQTPEYREYNELIHRMWQLQEEVDNL